MMRVCVCVCVCVCQVHVDERFIYAVARQRHVLIASRCVARENVVVVLVSPTRRLKLSLLFVLRFVLTVCRGVC